MWLGLGLIVIGLLVLLDQLRWIYFRDELIVSIAFVLGGLWLLSTYSRDKVTWKLICGLIALFVGFVIFLENSRIVSGDYLGGVVVWLLAAGFLVVYARNKKFWWAVIPGGILLTVGTIVMLEETFRRFRYSDSLFFLGMALTFGYLYVIRTPENKLNWAKWPAMIAVAICGIILLDEWFYYLNLEDYIAPAVLIAIGLFLVGRNFSRRENKHNGAKVTTT
jgi:hypothetical protein